MAHTTQQELASKVEDAKKQVEVGGTYHHYKSTENHYTVLAVGILEATEEVCVVYQAMYGDKIVWVRALPDWLATVETDQGFVPRFQKV